MDNPPALEAPLLADPAALAQRGHDRVIVEQATGVLAQRGALSMDIAFARLDRYARLHHVRLPDLAGEVLETDLAAVDVLTVGADITRTAATAARSSPRPRR